MQTQWQDLRYAHRMLAKSPGFTVVAVMIRLGTCLTLLGEELGIFGSVALHQAIASVLFGVLPPDVRLIAVSTICLLSIALLAGSIPARRATRVDAMVALRYE